MSLLTWIFGKKEPKTDTIPMPPENYTKETQEAVRKWLQRIFPGENLQDAFWHAVKAYKSKNGHEPVVNDIIWGLLNERKGRFFKDGNLGLYRSETLSMCILLEMEKKEQLRLFHLIELTTLDACGVQNLGWNTPFGSPLKPDEAYIAPICVPALVECAKELDISLEALELEFISKSEEVLKAFGEYRPKINSRNIWDKINAEVKQSYNDYQPPKRRTSKKQPSLMVIKT